MVPPVWIASSSGWAWKKTAVAIDPAGYGTATDDETRQERLRSRRWLQVSLKQHLERIDVDRARHNRPKLVSHRVREGAAHLRTGCRHHVW